jgi:hypothetical protein
VPSFRTRLIACTMRLEGPWSQPSRSWLHTPTHTQVRLTTQHPPVSAYTRTSSSTAALSAIQLSSESLPSSVTAVAALLTTSPLLIPPLDSPEAPDGPYHGRQRSPRYVVSTPSSCSFSFARTVSCSVSDYTNRHQRIHLLSFLSL